MFTKECNQNKYCLFYVSEFHLEMILLPYIKEKMNDTDVVIYTEENLTESIKVLLDRTNFTKEDKNKILGFNWNKKEENFEKNKEDSIIIINGSNNYIEETDKRISNMHNAKIIHCYNICKNKFNIDEMKKKYKGILNTGSYFLK